MKKQNGRSLLNIPVLTLVSLEAIAHHAICFQCNPEL